MSAMSATGVLAAVLLVVGASAVVDVAPPCPYTRNPRGVHHLYENANPPRTPLGPQAKAYSRVLRGCVFL